MKEFIIKDGVLAKYTGKEASIVVPEEVRAIAAGSLPFEVKEITLTGGVETVESMALRDIVRVRLAADFCGELRADAFHTLNHLEEIVVEEENETYAVIDRALFLADAMELVLFPGGEAKGLVKYDVPEGTRRIGAWAFSCTYSMLETISLPDGLLEIGECAFMNNKKLKAMTLPPSVVSIGHSAFRSCRALESADLGGVLEIPGNAFSDCEALKTIRIPAACAKIDPYAFVLCPAIEQIEVSPENAAFTVVDGVMYDESGTVLLRYPSGRENGEFDIPEGVVSIGPRAFAESRVEAVSIPGSVEVLCQEAFGGCKSLQEIEVDAGRIEAQAFNYCATLEYVSLGRRVREIGPAAFRGCWLLREIVIPQGVTAISPCTFEECETLQAVTLPEGLLEISQSAFEGCKGLRQLVIPEGVTFIGESAFADCRKLKQVSLPASLRTIGADAFKGCSALKSIVVPLEAEIAGSAFPSSVKVLRGSAEADAAPVVQLLRDGELDGFVVSGGVLLKYTGKKRKIVIPEGVTKIGRGVFQGVPIVSLELPDTLEEIGPYAFVRCDKLSRVILNAGLKRIGCCAFGGATALREVTVPGTVEFLATNAFNTETGAGAVNLICEDPSLRERCSAVQNGCVIVRRDVVPYWVNCPFEVSVGDVVSFGSRRRKKRYSGPVAAIVSDQFEDVTEVNDGGVDYEVFEVISRGENDEGTI